MRHFHFPRKLTFLAGPSFYTCFGEQYKATDGAWQVFLEEGPSGRCSEWLRREEAAAEKEPSPKTAEDALWVQSS